MKVFCKISYIACIFLIGVLTFSCIFQIVNITHERYFVHVNQEKINTLSRENRFELHETKKVFSLREVEEAARDMNFIDEGAVTYLRVPATEVVVR